MRHIARHSVPFVLVLLLGTAPLPQAEGQQQLAQALVTRIIDGDTFDAAVGGRRDRVRPIGVDAPEATSKVELYGQEATAFARRWLSGKTVWLERDVQPRDRYRRLLAYVFLEPPTSRTMTEIRIEDVECDHSGRGLCSTPNHSTKRAVCRCLQDIAG